MDKEIPQDIQDRIEYYNNAPKGAQEFKKLRPVELECEYCGQQVVNRTENLRLYNSPKPHWRKRCLECKLFYNPETQKFDLTQSQSMAFFKSYHKNIDK